MSLKTFYAPVQWWDSSGVSVLCPFCDRIHNHGFGQNYGSNHRLSHCYIDPGSFDSYYFRYPFSLSPETTAYEIDKANRRYVTLGASPPQDKVDPLVQAVADLNVNDNSMTRLPKWEDAQETIVLDDNDPAFRRVRQYFGGDPTFETKKIGHVIHRMLGFGDVEYVQKYIITSAESPTFIRGISEEGQTALWLAACEDYPAIVKLLLSHGADPDFQTDSGRTPLMQAALWGRPKNVEHLLERGANKALRDSQGHLAIDLAIPSSRNDEERHQNGVYKEDTYKANLARKKIVAFLEDDTNEDTSPASHQRLEEALFHKSATKVKVFSPTSEYEISTPYKTIGLLSRGGKYPPIAAMSGWSHNESLTLVSGHDWTPQVIQIARLVGHTLILDRKDQRTPGQYHACHAEKQLIAYFIDRHVFLEHEKSAPNSTYEFSDSPIRTLGDLQDAGLSLIYNESADLHELSTITPPVMLKKASILVSSPPCDDCTRFTAAVCKKLKLEIKLENRNITFQ